MDIIAGVVITSISTNFLFSFYLLRNGYFGNRVVKVKQTTEQAKYDAHVRQGTFRDVVVYTRNDEPMWSEPYFVPPRVFVEPKKE
jgi:hypothetical protein